MAAKKIFFATDAQSKDEALRPFMPGVGDIEVGQSLYHENGKLYLETGYKHQGDTKTSTLEITDSGKPELQIRQLEKNWALLKSDLQEVRSIVAGYIYNKTGVVISAQPAESALSVYYKKLLGHVIEQYMMDWEERVESATTPDDWEYMHPLIPRSRVLRHMRLAIYESKLDDSHEKPEIKLDDIEKKIILHEDNAEQKLRNIRDLIRNGGEGADPDAETNAFMALGLSVAKVIECLDDVWADSLMELRRSAGRSDMNKINARCDALEKAIEQAREDYRHLKKLTAMVWARNAKQPDSLDPMETLLDEIEKDAADLRSPYIYKPRLAGGMKAQTAPGRS